MDSPAISPAIVDTTTGRIAAVLDWELCTLGDPLADLGYLGVYNAGTSGQYTASDITGTNWLTGTTYSLTFTEATWTRVERVMQARARPSRQGALAESLRARPKSQRRPQHRALS